ncbi:unnamed protein product [Macrosiphum euphorbiae]|uniref:DUF659 domain-containing protein n=1 Tax=Macrosiphum euphorbiae TaxID=13131 RepID=A0AAV0VUZ8_9HEMI|nr:unnamed protein product [Macrosiphum euphorbiae]
MGERRVEANLAFIKSNVSFLSSALIPLEEKGKSVSSSVAIINVVSEKLSIATSSPKGKSIYTTFQKVLDKNSGYKVLSKISKIIDGKTDSFDGLPEAIETIDIVNIKYAPANFVDVERSFSAYKNIPTVRYIRKMLCAEYSAIREPICECDNVNVCTLKFAEKVLNSSAIICSTIFFLHLPNCCYYVNIYNLNLLHV